MRLIFLSFIPLFLAAQTASTTLVSVDGDRAQTRIEQGQKGLSGLVVRHFNDEHSAIIANALVTDYDDATKQASLALTPYDGLRQNTLPSGSWEPRAGDELRIAPDYSHALLIAPDSVVYDRITAAFQTISWVYPDRFAAYLSRTGHPSPTAEDFNGFCTDNAVGLLYVYLEHSLFTLDCKSMQLLQTANAPIVYEHIKRPFYSRVDTIRKAWWGDGTDIMERYAPYYLGLMEESNPESTVLKTYRDSQEHRTFVRDNAAAEDDTSSSWFGGLFDDVEVGLERDNKEE